MKMHQLTSRFILLLLFTLSAVSALPTPNTEAKNVVRENPLIQDAIPKFVSKGMENPGEDDEDTEVQAKVEEDEHRGEQVEEQDKDKDVNTIVLIVVNESGDEIKQEVDINAEEKSEEGPEGEGGRTDSENSGKINDDVGVTTENEDDEDRSEVDVAVVTNSEENEKEVEVVADVDADNDNNNEESKSEVKVVENSEVIVENNSEEGQSEGSSEVKVEVEVEVKAGKNKDEGGCEAGVGVIVEETEECCDETCDEKDECSAEYHPETEYALIISLRKRSIGSYIFRKNHEQEPIFNHEQEKARYDFKLEPVFKEEEEEEDVFFQSLPSESDRHSASVRFNHHKSNCYHYSYANHESHPQPHFEDGVPKRCTSPTEPLHQLHPPEEKPKSLRSGFRGASVNVTQSQIQPAEGPLPHTLVHPSPLPEVEIYPSLVPQVEIHPIDATKAEQLQEQEQQAGRFPHNTEHFVYKKRQWLEQGQEGMAISNSQSVGNTPRKRSAKPKRLPAHHVMEKHLKFAETSPHLLGVESVEQFRDIWQKNLPYPVDGSPMRVGGPIRKRSAGRESRIVEQRQRENELRQAYGKPTKTTVQRPDGNEKDIGLQEIKDEKKSLSELSNFGYKLGLGKTNEQIALEQEQELRQQTTQQQQKEAACNCDVCRGNAERKREKEQMRHGDSGLLVQLFPPQKQG